MLSTPTGDRSSWAVTARNRACSSAAAASSAFASLEPGVGLGEGVGVLPLLLEHLHPLGVVAGDLGEADVLARPRRAIAVIVTCAQNRLPSLRTRQPSSW